MGKRSDFERRERDFYPTPLKAVEPLIPFINGTKRFAEPCVGTGDLVHHLDGFGLKCIYTSDIEDGIDALTVNSYGRGSYNIITNPPHKRTMLHPLIEHFQKIAPTWLLIDLDWVANLQAVPYLPKCSDIVIIGRVKWIPDTPHTGKENYCWARFWHEHSDGPRLHNRRGVA
jgi:hypothetical protein